MAMLLASTSNIILAKINVVPMWLWVICIFCFYFLAIDKWEAKKTARKEIREKEKQAEEIAKQEELWYSSQRNRLNNLNPDEREILRGYNPSGLQRRCKGIRIGWRDTACG